ncbi:hypothetical protein TcasGA2_TC013899 [Tribolium castaneum]|uniref:Uncharacterized protein n=1 Tax=Tribolium castaneum TaxID=7070 RepID=D6WMP5_TRICA|nr:hypothetical protein TcasGA2_TC013899 [Tribolium castaneum]
MVEYNADNAPTERIVNYLCVVIPRNDSTSHKGQDDALDSRLRMTSLVESKYVPAIDWWSKTPSVSLRMRPKKKICIKKDEIS